MKFFEETTRWADASTSNHVYLLSDDKSKMYAYVPVGTDSVFQFKNPIRIDTRGRTFRVVSNTYNFNIVKEPRPSQRTWQVAGSRGDEYTVTETDHGLTCSCSGFKFRGKCRHSIQIAQNLT